RKIYSPGIIAVSALAQRIVYCHQLGAVRECRFNLHLGEHLWDSLHDLIPAENLSAVAHQFCDGFAITGPFQQFRTDHGHSFRVIELEATLTPPPCHLSGNKNEELVDLTRRQMHVSPSLLISPSLPICARPPLGTQAEHDAVHPTPRAVPDSLSC